MSKSQNQLILEHMQQGNRITAIDALNKFGCFRLASRISDLNSGKFDGTHYQIQSDWIESNGKRYKDYFIEVEAKQTVLFE